MEIVTATPSSVNLHMSESLTSLALLDASRELERQYLADALVAFELAEIASRHEQDEIHNVMPKPLDQLPDPDRAAFIAHAKIALRMNRPAWRALKFAREKTAAIAALNDLASQWIPADQIEVVAHHLTALITTAGRYALDEQTVKVLPREFADALEQVKRRGPR